ncbi:hypothetical protein R3X27_08965 [Tropicimonas sp. TH_r6]|uniref:hypothetical protein n=1 Tax=Tropicimonas sp. TH_r6 TaxID=3082085 RepID=UPI002952DDAC|nr:hypothetical protein [Tropicimonas sp. TH_r6]MDV7142813.1 hypothetical protein [Tropicimonas sp. TH_r6]
MSDTSIVHVPTNWNALLLAPVRAVLKGLVIFQLAQRQAKLAQKLINLSDVELGKRGLTREQIPQFVANLAP